jgi:hypothetical protein
MGTGLASSPSVPACLEAVALSHTQTNTHSSVYPYAASHVVRTLGWKRHARFASACAKDPSGYPSGAFTMALVVEMAARTSLMSLSWASMSLGSPISCKGSKGRGRGQIIHSHLRHV